MKKCTLCFFCVILSLGAFSQGNISVDQDFRIENVSKAYSEMQSIQKEKKGYRLQLISSSNQAKVSQLENDFTNKYGLRAYTTYKSPNFKLRVGDFEDKLEAYRFLQKIKHKYSSSFIVEDLIEIP